MYDEPEAETQDEAYAIIVRRRYAVVDSMVQTGPEHFDMDYWYRVGGENADLPEVATVDLAACGTTACIAGHAAYTAYQQIGRYIRPESWLQVHHSIFYAGDWPDWLHSRGTDWLHTRATEYISGLVIMMWLADHPDARALPANPPMDIEEYVEAAETVYASHMEETTDG